MIEQALPTVFVIENDAAVRDSLGMLLERHGFVACLYASAASFLIDAHPEPASFIVVDMDLDGMSGLDLLNEFYQRGIVVPAILTTSGRVTEHLRSAADRAGVTLLEKPYPPDALIAHLRRTFDNA